LRYDLNWGRWEYITLFKSILFNSLIYSSTTFRSKLATALLVVMIIPLLLNQMKLANTSDLTSFKSLLMFEAWAFAWDTIVLALSLLIGIITCFLEGSLIVFNSYIKYKFPLHSIVVSDIMDFNNFTRR